MGCGGAGFPTHVKLRGSADTLLINAAECEPLLGTDRYIVRNFAKRLVDTASLLGSSLSAGRVVIGLKSSYEREIAALKNAMGEGCQVELGLLDSFYPAGDEQVLVYELTGRVVPPAGIPLDVGCVVVNAATLLAIADSVEGRPFTHKYLTVTGDVERPGVLNVPIGTSVAECIRAAGGDIFDGGLVILGGPMMGKRLSPDEARSAAVTKTTSGIITLRRPMAGYMADPPLARMLNRAKAACIRCRQCTDLCPRHLLGHPIEPHRVMRSLAAAGDIKEILDLPEIRAAAVCSECGVCEVIACPMQLSPRSINAAVKRELAAAKIRYPKGEGQSEVSPERGTRKIPTARAAARAGVAKLYHRALSDELVTLTPNRVSLSTRQHIGAPAAPVVNAGDRVVCGDVIAVMDEGKMGAVLHASIDGEVEKVLDGYIVISKRGERP